MGTIPARVSVPTRQRLCLAAAFALVVEAGVLGGIYLMMTHRHVPSIEPPPTVLSLVAATVPEAPAKVPTPTASPEPKPAPVARPVAAVPHVTHTIMPRVRPTPAPPQATPQAATVPPSIAPTEPPTAAPAPAMSPAPAMPSTRSAPLAPSAPTRPSASFDGALRAAIQAALIYPESARMGGIAGRTRVAFDYRDGAVSDAHVLVSSGVGLLDRAALAAVRDAAYPKPDASFAGKTLSEQLWVTFNLNETE